MRSMTCFICGLWLMGFLSSCQSITPHKPVKLVGILEGSGQEKVYLWEQDVIELKKIDSVQVAQDGSFRFNFDPEEKSIFLIRIRNDIKIVFIASPGDEIYVTGKLTDIPASVRIQGQEESALLQEFYSYTKNNMDQVDSLQGIISQHQDDPDFAGRIPDLDMAFNSIWEAQRRYEKAFITRHPCSIASLLVLNFHFGVKPVLSIDTDGDDYRKVDSCLMVNLSENKHVKFFHSIYLKKISVADKDDV